MTLSELNSYDEAFVSKVKKYLPKDADSSDILILPTGLVMVLNSRQENQGHRPLGCPTCLDMAIGQNSEGYPTINGVKLLTPQETNQNIDNVSPEIISNLWLCPTCHIPVKTLLPQFDLTAL